MTKRLVSLLLSVALLALALPACAVKAPEVRWSFAVSLSTLKSTYVRLVDKEHLLEENYVPENLVKVTLRKVGSSTIQLDSIAYDALCALFDGAAAEGCSLLVKSGYRSYGTQKTMYRNRLEKDGGKDTGVVAAPGASDHQTGWGCDILNTEYAGKPRMTSDFGATMEGQWLQTHCADYGFVIRYPEGKEELTGTIYEPWHLRYVGREAASYIMGRGLCLEEFTQEAEDAIAMYQMEGGDIDALLAYEAEHESFGPEPFYTDTFGEDGDVEVSMKF